MRRSDRGRNMRFGIDRSSARGEVQLAFGGGLADGRIDAREIRGPRSRKSLGNAPRPRRVARPALRRRDDGASHEPGSADKFLDESDKSGELKPVPTKVPDILTSSPGPVPLASNAPPANKPIAN